MKLAAKTDIDVPVGFVYESLADHTSWEHEAAERGIDVRRAFEQAIAGPGDEWSVTLPYRGKLVTVALRLVQTHPDSRLDFDFKSNAIEGDLQIAAMALSPRRTRLNVVIDIRPRTLASRVFLNTLRLAKGRVETRFAARLQQIGFRILARYSRTR